MNNSALPAGAISLTGQLICADQSQGDIVREYLPSHIELTRAEPGCISFEVAQTSDSLVWQVDELFESAEAFAAHQERVRGSEWGRATAAITRSYEIHEL